MEIIMAKTTIPTAPVKVSKSKIIYPQQVPDKVQASNEHPDYPEFIKLPYKLAHFASRSDRRIKLLLHAQVAEHKAKLKKK